MNIPTTIKKDEDKVKFLYRALELLRLEHNKLGDDFMAGKITEKEFRNYQKGEHREKTAKIFKELNPIKEKLGMFEMLDKDGILKDENDPKVSLKEDGKKEAKWDLSINLKQI